MQDIIDGVHRFRTQIFPQKQQLFASLASGRWPLRFELELRVSEARVDVVLRGVLSFLALPRLSSALERLPQTSELHLPVDGLRFVDHAGLCALRDFEAQASARGVRVLLDWDHLDARREGSRVAAAP